MSNTVLENILGLEAGQKFSRAVITVDSLSPTSMKNFLNLIGCIDELLDCRILRTAMTVETVKPDPVRTAAGSSTLELWRQRYGSQFTADYGEGSQDEKEAQS